VIQVDVGHVPGVDPVTRGPSSAGRASAVRLTCRRIVWVPELAGPLDAISPAATGFRLAVKHPPVMSHPARTATRRSAKPHGFVRLLWNIWRADESGPPAVSSNKDETDRAKFAGKARGTAGARCSTHTRRRKGK
jgi:hypothetical protein